MSIGQFFVLWADYYRFATALRKRNWERVRGVTLNMPRNMRRGRGYNMKARVSVSGMSFILNMGVVGESSGGC